MSVPAPEAPAATPPAAPAAPATTPPAVPAAPGTAAAPATDDKPLGPNGEKALQSEREARKAEHDARVKLEEKLASLAPLEKLAAALGGGDPDKAKTEIELLTERQTNFETEMAKEREARWRAEIANEKGLTPTQAGRLRGATREELATDADALVADFGITPGTPGTPATPKPDPSQGARPSGTPDIDQQIREAESKGNVRESIRLKTLKSMQPAK